jgi:hypothetical protein
MAINFSELKREIPYKFKPQTVKNGKALMVAYIDSRDVQDLLDEVVGPENWSDEYNVVNQNMYAGLSINVTGDPDNPRWVTKWDCGTESNTEQEKGEASDAFKRAAVKWGIGRFLYRLGVVELPTKEYKGKERPATHDGKILWSNDEISEYIRSGMKSGAKAKSTETSAPEKKPTYEKPKTEPKYSKTLYTEETIKRVSSLEKNGKKGKDALKEYLAEYNKANESNFEKIQDLDNSALNKLIDYIENLAPQGI